MIGVCCAAAGIGMVVWAVVSVGAAVIIGRAITLADSRHRATALAMPDARLRPPRTTAMEDEAAKAGLGRRPGQASIRSPGRRSTSRTL